MGLTARAAAGTLNPHSLALVRGAPAEPDAAALPLLTADHREGWNAPGGWARDGRFSHSAVWACVRVALRLHC